MINLTGEFVVRIGDELKTYANTDSIPEHFDNLIKFKPTTPSPPHTSMEHEEMEEYLSVFRDIMSRETKGKFTNF